MATTVDQTRGIYRRIYAGFLTGKRINSVSLEAEAWFWRLQALADDFGTFPADPDVLHLQAAPRRKVVEQTSEQYLEALVNANLIRLYRVDGERFGEIAMFSRFQPASKNGRRIKKYPPCPEPWLGNPGESGGIQGDPGESGGIQGDPGESGKSSVPHTHTHTHTQAHTHKHPHTQTPPQGVGTSGDGGGGDIQISIGGADWRDEAEARMVALGVSRGVAREFAQHPALDTASLAETWRGVVNDGKVRSRVPAFIHRMQRVLGIPKRGSRSGGGE